MIEVFETDIYKNWYDKLRDANAKARIKIRIRRISMGNVGDCKFVGDAVYELRIDYGGGYRIYFKNIGEKIILLLCGGNKSTQQSDIEKAKELAKDL